jgi:hypothetical protein
MQNYMRYFSCILIALVLLAGCATTSTRTALFHNPTFVAGSVDSVTVLPVIDYRTGRKLTKDISEVCFRGYKNALNRKGYRFEMIKDQACMPELQRGTLAAISGTQLNDICPGTGNWVFISAVIRQERKPQFLAIKGEAVIEGYLYDRTSGELLWQDQAIGSEMGGVLLSGMVDTMSLERAASDLLLSFPSNEAQ